ncbi:MAG: FG-GAP-like repeat-containing protein [Bacteroidota bacterium]
MIYLNQGPSNGYAFGVGTDHTPNRTLQNSDFHDNNMNTEGVFLADFDNDGWLDLVVENHNYGIDIFVNPKDGTANFICLDPSVTGLPASATDGDYGSCVDFDDDGDIDIIARKRNENDFFVNNGDGTFVDGQNIDDANNGNKGGVSFADFDNDGDYDLFWTDNGVNQIWLNDGTNTLVPTNGGSGTGEPWASAGIAAPSSGIDGCATGDVNNDGKMDLFLTADNGTSFLFLNQTADGGSLSFMQDNLGIDVDANGEGCAFADYDNDGDLDLYLNVRNGNNQLWRNDLNDGGAADYLYIEPRIDLGGGIWRAAVGANIVLEDCDGNVVSGIREVPTTSGHGTDASDCVHFGLPGGPNQLYNVVVRFVAVNGTRVEITKQITPAEIAGQLLVIYDTDPNSIGRCDDFDQDGTPDRRDLDDDSDGTPDWAETYLQDHDGDGTPDYQDAEFCTATFQGVQGWDCADGLPDPSGDLDGDGTANYLDADFPGCGGLVNGICAAFDQDQDGLPNHLDLDSDNDGIPDLVEAGGSDAEGDGIVDCFTKGATYDVSLTVTDNDGNATTHRGTLTAGENPSSNFDPAGTVGSTSTGGCATEATPDVNDWIFRNDWSDQDNGSTISNSGGDLVVNHKAWGREYFLLIQTGVGRNLVSGQDVTVTFDVKAHPKTTGMSVGLVDPANLDWQGPTSYVAPLTAVGGTFSEVNYTTKTVTLSPNATLANAALVIRVDLVRDGAATDYYFNDLEFCDGNGAPVQGPTSIISVTSNSASEPFQVAFSGSASSDSDGSIVSYLWDFGDGTTGTGPTPTHTYAISSGVLTDSDDDGWCDIYDNFGNAFTGGTPMAVADKDGDGIADLLDLDSDNDGIPDLIEAGGVDTDGDGRVDGFQDSDADGLHDPYDPTDNDPESTNDATFVSAANAPLITTQTDANADGLADEGYQMGDTDGDGLLDQLDLDADNDGIPDIIETGGLDADGDGRVDNANPDGSLTADVDQDGFSDTYDPDLNNDGDTNDPGDTGLPQIISGNDGDNDGRPESYPAFDNDGDPGTANAATDTDGDGIPNYLDLDADNDGIPDLVEVGGIDNNGDGKVDGLSGSGEFSSGQDADEDGFYDAYDPDDNTTSTDENQSLDPVLTTAASGTGDNDGHPALPDLAGNANLNGGANADFDGDGVPNYLDLDSDNDGITDVVETFGYDKDDDNSQGEDGQVDNQASNDSDTNGWHDTYQGLVPTAEDANRAERANNTLPDYATGNTNPDFDGDGMPNYLDIDADDDGIVDLIEGQPSGTNLGDPFDGLMVNLITDTDYDGLTSAFDPDESGTYVVPPNEDGTAGEDFLDLDTDNDGFADLLEGHDANLDGIADNNISGIDADLDGLDDAFDTDTNSPDPQASNQPVQDENSDVGSGGDRDWRDGSSSSFPVEWLGFDAKLKGADAELTWATAREENSDYFEVQRSIDGQMFESQGQVKSAGNTDSTTDYDFRDIGVGSLPVEKVYYRLRQVDMNGQFSFSEVEELALTGNNRLDLQVYPNPTAGPLTVSWTLLQGEESVNLQLLNVAGQIVKSESIPSMISQYEWNMEDLPDGQYIVKLQQGSQVVTQMVVKK